MLFEALLKRPHAVFFILLGLLLGSVLVIGRLGLSSGMREGSVLQTVTLRDFGFDARSMEELVSIPIEDACSRLRGLEELRSTSEYGTSRIYARFTKGPSPEAQYLAFSAEVLRVYAQLPSTVQKPEFGSSLNSDEAMWLVSLQKDGKAPDVQLLETVIKPALSSISGVARVDVSGSETEDLIIEVAEQELAASGISLDRLGQELAGSDKLYPLGQFRSASKKQNLVLDARLPFNDIKDFQLTNQAGYLRSLGDFAVPVLSPRLPERLVRINGSLVSTLAVQATENASLPELSKKLAKAIKGFESSLGIKAEIHIDQGKSLDQAQNNMLAAGFFSVLLVALAGFVFVKTELVILRMWNLFSVGLVLLFSLALVTLLGSGNLLFTLAGLALGLGSAVDSTLIMSEQVAGLRRLEDAPAMLKRCSKTLLGGLATTLIVLLPLVGLDDGSGMMRDISLAIAVSSIVAYLCAVIFQPPLSLINWKPYKRDLEVREQRQNSVRPPRLFRLVYFFLQRHVFILLLIVIGLSVLGFVGGAGLKLNVKPMATSGERYVHVEYEAGTALEIVDARVAVLAAYLEQVPGVLATNTTARIGSASVFIRYDANIKTTKILDQELANLTSPGGFVWSAESAQNKQLWEISVFGPDDELAKTLVRELANKLAEEDFVEDQVLYFKDAAADLVLYPEREKLASLGLGLGELGQALRSTLYGPVTYKRIREDREIDVRIRGSGGEHPGLASLDKVYLEAGGQTIRVQSLVRLEREPGLARIDRRDRLRLASLGIATRESDPRRVKKLVAPLLAAQVLPEAYFIEFDAAAISRAQKTNEAILAVFVAAVLALIVLVILTESFIFTLLALLFLLPSLALPLGLLAVLGMELTSALACAFVASAGICINGIILALDEAGLPGRVQCSGPSLLKRIYPRLSATNLSTIAAALPVLFFSQSSGGGAAGFVFALSFVQLSSVATSYFVSLFLIPLLTGILGRKQSC